MPTEINIIGCLDSSYESSGRVYCYDGLCPTLNTMSGGNRQPMIIDCVNKEESARQRSIRAKVTDDGWIRFYKDDARKSGVSELQLQNGDGVACTTNFCRGNTFGATGVVESIPVRMVGRNPDNPTSHEAGLPTEQRIELVKSGLCGNLTTVQKDTLVLEKKPELQYRIRKLTPRCCWRLMGYKDGDFDKASEVNSSTQLYKQAGNAIVKQVLMAVFLQLGIQGKKRWNDMTFDERQELIDGSLDFLEDER